MASSSIIPLNKRRGIILSPIITTNPNSKNQQRDNINVNSQENCACCGDRAISCWSYSPEVSHSPYAMLSPPVENMQTLELKLSGFDDDMQLSKSELQELSHDKRSNRRLSCWRTFFDQGSLAMRFNTVKPALDPFLFKSLGAEIKEPTAKGKYRTAINVWNYWEHVRSELRLEDDEYEWPEGYPPIESLIRPKCQGNDDDNASFRWTMINTAQSLSDVIHDNEGRDP
ncbi:hypothetical protein B0O99DRAFT_683424 [Bisporella sp. PMI_857]|nr:hypothetical protein B0O99DRAFT_683424 [Bisporella sp. PMI_857]